MDPFAPEPPPVIAPPLGKPMPRILSGEAAVYAKNMLILCTSTALAIAFSSLALIMPDAFQSMTWRQPMIGYMFGTTLGIALTAALWCTLGPGPFAYRVPLSLLWIVGVTLGWLGNYLLHDNAPPLEAVAMMGIASSAMWFVPQVPLWGFRFLARISVALPDSGAVSEANQFGIRQLIIYTTLVAALLGGARIAISALSSEFSRSAEPVLALTFIVTAGILLSAPLALAMLLQRFSLVAVVLVLSLVTIATQWESSLANAFIPSPGGGGPDMWFFIWINAFTAVWILILTGIARLCGYRLVRG